MKTRLRALIGKNVRYYRIKLKLTQEAVAVASKLHPNYVYRLEHGRTNITADNLEVIATVLKVKPHILLMPRED